MISQLLDTLLRIPEFVDITTREKMWLGLAQGVKFKKNFGIDANTEISSSYLK